jgi:hypothetical protein
MSSYISLLIGSVGLILISISIYRWLTPSSRKETLSQQLFATDTQRAKIYLPSEFSWNEGHGLAIWTRRGSRKFAIVRRGAQEGKPSFFEFGMGRLSLVQEVDAVDQALRLLLEMRSAEESAAAKKFEDQERSKKEHEEVRLKVAAAKQLENDLRITARHTEWARHEDQMNEVLQTLSGFEWRPKRTQLPAGVNISEAWDVVSAMIDNLVSGLRHGDIGSEFSETRTLIFGLVGASDWLSNEPRSNEALMWAAVFSLLSDINDGRTASSAIVHRFAKAEQWDLVHGLSIAWARIEADQLDQSRFTPLIKCASGAMVRWWRINQPTDFSKAEMPSYLASQLEERSKATPVMIPPVIGDKKIQRIDEFVRSVCR